MLAIRFKPAFTASSSTGFSNMPSITGDTSLTMTLLPAGRSVPRTTISSKRKAISTGTVTSRLSGETVMILPLWTALRGNTI